jgi:catechol 2,3-dioxygenase-like lactoylglutathione lyase family enzyme
LVVLKRISFFVNNMVSWAPYEQGKKDMPKFNFVLLYVDNPLASAEFYADLMGCKPIETSPTFAMLPLLDGVLLGLWSRTTVEPAAVFAPGAGEIAFTVEGNQVLQSTYKDWVERGLTIAQEPTHMDFGNTFVALDPDGHRIRVFSREN